MKKGKLLWWLFIAGFATNLIWENVQAPLYEGYGGFIKHFLFCLVAGIVDGAMVVVFYLLISVIRRDPLWLLTITLKDLVILAILATLVAIGFEIAALKTESWAYTENMPLIFGLGLIPLMQLSTLSIISIYLVKFRIEAKRKPG